MPRASESQRDRFYSGLLNNRNSKLILICNNLEKNKILKPNSHRKDLINFWAYQPASSTLRSGGGRVDFEFCFNSVGVRRERARGWMVAPGEGMAAAALVAVHIFRQGFWRTVKGARHSVRVNRCSIWLVGMGTASPELISLTQFEGAAAAVVGFEQLFRFALFINGHPFLLTIHNLMYRSH